jgi:hypothetical protein
MAIVMNISGYEIEREKVTLDEYDDERQYAEWVPQLDIGDSRVHEMDKTGEFPGELANVDVDAFLEKMYEYRH